MGLVHEKYNSRHGKLILTSLYTKLNTTFLKSHLKHKKESLFPSQNMSKENKITLFMTNIIADMMTTL